MKPMKSNTKKGFCLWLAAVLALSLFAAPVFGLAETAEVTEENPYGFSMTADEAWLGENGAYSIGAVICHENKETDGMLLHSYVLQAVLKDSEGVSISKLTVKDAEAAVYTMQALDAEGLPLGEQKTMMIGMEFVMPENSHGFVMKLYGNGEDFRLLSADYAGVTIETGLVAQENAQAGSFEVLLTAEKRNADGTAVEPAVYFDMEPAVFPLPAVPAAEEEPVFDPFAQAALDNEAAGQDMSGEAEETVETEETESVDTESVEGLPEEETPAEEENPSVEEMTEEPAAEPVYGRIVMNASPLPEGTGAALAGVDMQLSAQTAADGSFAFEELPAGDYSVFVTLPDGMVPAAGSAWQLTEQGDMIWLPVTLSEGQEVALEEIAFETGASLEFTAFVDSKGKGEKAEDSKPVPGVKVEVLSGETVLASGYTDENGVAKIADIAPGSHQIRVTGTNGYSPADKGPDSCVERGGGYIGVSEPVEFAAGQTTVAGGGFELLASFSGRVFEDLNNDGLMDDTDPGVAGVVLRLEGLTSGVVYEITTDETGVFSFGGLYKEKDSFSATLPDGCLYARYSKTGGDLRSVFTGSNLVREFRVGKREQVTNKNVGVIQNGVMTGVAFMDLNYNGVYDEGEPGVKGVTLEAIKVSNGDSYGKVVTDENGAYSLPGLRGGDYRLRAILPDDGSQFTRVPENPGENANRFVQREGRREYSVEPINIQSGSKVNVPVGVAVGATVRGTVFTDADYDGQMAGSEKIISGVEVIAVDENGVVWDTTTTNKEGKYALHGLMPGKYVIKFAREPGNGFTRLRPQLENGSYVVELLDGYGITGQIDISMGQLLEKVNAGMLPSATVTGTFFMDLNDNGVKDEGENGMAGVKARLLSEDGEVDLLRPVEENGRYFFDGVMPGNYTITYQLPEHCEMAKVADGGNTLAHQGAENTTDSFLVAMGEENKRPLVGGVELGSLSGSVFTDSDASGAKEEGETALSGAVITLIHENGEEFTASADAEGNYSLANLRPGAYQISVKMPEGYIVSHEVEGLPFAAAAETTLPCGWNVLVSRESLNIGGVKPADISGSIWLDENKDGSHGAEEALLPGLTLNLVNEETGVTVASVQSDENGFHFANVRPGTYSVSFAMPAQSESANDPASGFVVSEGTVQQSGITLAEGETRTDLTAGLVSRTSIGGNLSLLVGSETTMVSGVEVSLWQEGGSAAVATTTTDENGNYRFDGLWPGQYQIKSALPDGMIFVRPDDPNYPAGASVVTGWDEVSGTSDSFGLQMAKHQLDKNIAFIKPAKVGDQAWLDDNANGLIDGGEMFIPGVKVTLMSGGQAAYETTTDAYGYYLFDQVYPGTYTLVAAAYPELTITTPVDSLKIISSALTSGDGNQAATGEFTVQSGSSNMDFNLGYVLQPGQSKPAAIVAPPTKDWTVNQEKYLIVSTQDWDNAYDPNK